MLNKKSILVFAILISNLFSCILIPSNSNNSNEYIQKVEIKSISIEPLDTVLKEGESKLLTALLYTEDDKIDNSNTNIEWSSEDRSIVDVDKYGKIKALKSGEVGILAKYKYGNSIRRSIVTVVGKKIINNIVINSTLVELKPDESFNLSATVYMVDGTKNSNVIWSSSDNTIAVIDENGNIKAKKIGLTTIVATYNLNNIYKKSVDVNITKEGKKIVKEIIKPKEQPAIISTTLNSSTPIPTPIPTSTIVSTPLPSPTPTSTIVSTPLPSPTPTSTIVTTPLPSLTPIITIVSTPLPTPTNTIVSTIAGNGTAGFSDGTSTTAQFDYPDGVAVDSSGNIYVADASNHSIRKITSNGFVTTIAGNGKVGINDGPGSNARFRTPTGVAIDSLGNIYVADTNNDTIRKINPDVFVTTIAGNLTHGFSDGTSTTAQFNAPFGVAVDSSGNIYVADTSNHSIRKITSNGFVTTIAGNGTAGFSDGIGVNAKFNAPHGVAVDSSGNIYVADTSNHSIRKITSNGFVTTIAGNGTAGFSDGKSTTAQFNYPNGVAVDGSGNIYVSDIGNNRIRKIK